MKYLFTISIIICSLGSFGQQKPPLKISTATGGGWSDTGTLSTISSNDTNVLRTISLGMASRNAGPTEYKKDTIRAILLVADTSLPHSVNWVNGYIERNVTIEKAGHHQSGFYMWYNEKDEYQYKYGRYLDDKKRLFHPSVIVWMARE